MPWSSGSFTRIFGASGWTNDRDASTYILATRHDTHDQDLADGINNCITKDGQSKPAATITPNLSNTYDWGSLALIWRSIYSAAFRLVNSGFYTSLTATTLTNNRTVQFPDTDVYIQAGTFTGVLGGYASTINIPMNYRIVNGICTIWTNNASASSSGISNSTNLTMTGLGSNATPQFATDLYIPTTVVDNGTTYNAVAIISPSFNRITFSLSRVSGSNITISATAFTASGTKGLTDGWCLTYPVRTP